MPIAHSGDLKLPSWNFLLRKPPLHRLHYPALTQTGSLIQDSGVPQYLVGTGGDTGAGKSSLLNVLISETGDIVPRSQNGACTAAVCCFSYPGPDASPRKFSAKVHLKSKDTVDDELAAFFQEYRELNQGAADRLGEEGSEITNRCHDRHLLFDPISPHRGLVITVAADNARDFRLAIKPYIGSQGRNAKVVRWPLVEMVEIFVVADILRDGIVLVDLPGETDALDARSQVARRYYNKLDRILVVASGDRAVDNKTAVDLIREDQVVDMEADGKLRDGSLGLVVTKVDQMEWQDFVESEWPTDSVPEELQRAVDGLETKKEDVVTAELRVQHITDMEAGDEPVANALMREEAERDLEVIEAEIRRLKAFCLRSRIDIQVQCRSRIMFDLHSKFRAGRTRRGYS